MYIIRYSLLWKITVVGGKMDIDRVTRGVNCSLTPTSTPSALRRLCKDERSGKDEND